MIASGCFEGDSSLAGSEQSNHQQHPYYYPSKSPRRGENPEFEKRMAKKSAAEK
jgi:hypothetical protein